MHHHRHETIRPIHANHRNGTRLRDAISAQRKTMPSTRSPVLQPGLPQSPPRPESNSRPTATADPTALNHTKTSIIALDQLSESIATKNTKPPVRPAEIPRAPIGAFQG
jgi:hypothetical protein